MFRPRKKKRKKKDEYAAKQGSNSSWKVMKVGVLGGTCWVARAFWEIRLQTKLAAVTKLHVAQQENMFIQIIREIMRGYSSGSSQPFLSSEPFLSQRF